MKNKVKYLLCFLLLVDVILNRTQGKLFAQCALTANTSQSNLLCAGDNNGLAWVNPSGGTPPYTYSWSTGSTASSVSGLSAGSYSVMVTDASCIVSGVELVSNGDFSSGNTGFSSSYGYCNAANCLVPEGTYGVGAASSFFHPLWCACTDHTSGSGNYMIVNGAGTPGVTVWCQTIAVTPNTTYNFSTWVTSVYASSPAQLQFSINGTALGSVFSAPSSCCTWQQFFAVWNSGANTSANICIVNQNTVFGGNDFGLDDISFKSCTPCTATATVTITVPPALTLSGNATDEYCNRADGTATVVVSGGTGNYSYSWNTTPVQNTPVATGLTTGNYSVMVTDANGCKHDTMLIVNFTAGPTASAGADITVCPATAASLNASGGVAYSWSPAVGLNNTSLSNPVAVPSATTGYTVIVTDVNGCTSADSQKVVVNTVPAAAFTTTDICLNTNPASFLNQSSGASLYQWNFGDGSPLNTEQSPVHAYGTPGTYSVTLTVQNGAGCKDSIIHTINVNPVPNAIFSSSIVCFNNPTVFTDQSIGAPVQWHWDFGDGATDTLQNPSHIYGAAGSYTVTMVCTNSLGCSDTLPLTAVVNPLPQALFYAPVVCVGSPTCFQDSSKIVSGVIAAWSWNFDDPASGSNNTSSVQYPCHLFSAAGNYNVILTVTSNNLCQSTVNLPVNVTVPPVASFTASTVCLNQPTVFTDASSGANAWSWNFGDGGISSAQHPVHTYLAYGSYVVMLIASSGGNCNDTITDTVEVNPSPIINFKSDSVCVGQPTSFTDASFIPADTIISWSWNFGDTVSGADNLSALQNPMHVFSSSGSFSVSLTVTASTGCTNKKTLAVYVNPGPVAGFSYSPASPAFFTEDVLFYDQSTGPPVQWWWNFGDSDTAVVQNPMHHFPDIGSYTVTLVVTSQNGCMDTVFQVVDIQEYTFYMPNAFTPDGDSNNDVFFGKGVGITEYELIIFDRWGNRIFYCKVNDLPQTLPCMWNGKIEAGKSNEIVQQDVYIWKVNLTDVFGESHKYIGTVTVVQ